MKFFLKELEIQEDMIWGCGWIRPQKDTDACGIKITNAGGNEIQVTFHCRRAEDAASKLYINQPDGAFTFTISFRKYEETPLRLVCYDFNNESDRFELMISDDYTLTGMNSKFAVIRKGISVAKGLAAASDKKEFVKGIMESSPAVEQIRYSRWLSRHLANSGERARQRKTVFNYMPVISVIVPVYNPRPEHLIAMIESVRKQTYTNWQLCLANGSGDNLKICRILHRYAVKDKRIKTARLRYNRGISKNTNIAMKLADGEWFAFADQDDLLSPEILFQYVKAINEDMDTDMLYCDEDKFDDEKKHRTKPYFKPDFNIDLLDCNNYICHMLMIRRTLIESVGPFDSRFDGAQDHDMILRCVEKTRHVKHVPKVLYSWRIHCASTAGNIGVKNYASDAGETAVNAHFKRMNIPARAEKLGWAGCYCTRFSLKETPLVSILIPNKDHTDDLLRCVNSILEKASYKNYEIIIVENNSEEKKTFEVYKELEKKDERIRVITWEGEFNYSAINNFGVRSAKGEYILLLNNDTEVISPDVLESMLGYSMRPDVGAVGIKLLYGDDTVQHAGVLIGVERAAHHVFLHYPSNACGYMTRACISQDMSGVTAACLMVSKKKYEEVGGLDESFVVAYNDVDFCLKLEKAGYLNVYDAFVRMYHYESKSRGYEITPEAQERFEGEKKRLSEKWKERLDADPYYNVNLSLKHGYYRI